MLMLQYTFIQMSKLQHFEGSPLKPRALSFKKRVIHKSVNVNVLKGFRKETIGQVTDTPAVSEEFVNLHTASQLSSQDKRNTRFNIKTPFWWPHEHLDELRAVNAARNPKAGNQRLNRLLWYFKYELRFVVEGTKNFIQSGNRAVQRNGALMRSINGEGAEVLSNKYQFIQLAKELGYAPQKQTLIKAGESSAELRQATQSADFSDPEQVVFLKPVGRGGGQGIKITTVTEAEKFLNKADQDFIMQESIKIGREYRYVVCQDGQNTWRIAYEKTRPTLIGDGVSTIKKLLDKQQIPTITRTATIFMNMRRLNKILKVGEQQQMQQIGMPKEGNFERMPEDMHQIENLDNFMAYFISDLEGKLGHKLPLLAFDIGFKDPAVLNGKYDFEVIRTNFIPFECQMPFITFHYYYNIPHGFQTLINFYNLMYRKTKEENYMGR